MRSSGGGSPPSPGPRRPSITRTSPRLRGRPGRPGAVHRDAAGDRRRPAGRCSSARGRCRLNGRRVPVPGRCPRWTRRTGRGWCTGTSSRRTSWWTPALAGPSTLPVGLRDQQGLTASIGGPDRVRPVPGHPGVHLARAGPRGLSVDGRADQYALACVAWHLLTGRSPSSATWAWPCCSRTCMSRCRRWTVAARPARRGRAGARQGHGEGAGGAVWVVRGIHRRTPGGLALPPYRPAVPGRPRAEVTALPAHPATDAARIAPRAGPGPGAARGVYGQADRARPRPPPPPMAGARPGRALARAARPTPPLPHVHAGGHAPGGGTAIPPARQSGHTPSDRPACRPPPPPRRQARKSDDRRLVPPAPSPPPSPTLKKAWTRGVRPGGTTLAAADATATSTCGTPRPEAHRQPHRPRSKGVDAWRSARAARPWPRPTPTAAPTCGTPPPGSSPPPSPTPPVKAWTRGVQPGRDHPGRGRL